MNKKHFFSRVVSFFKKLLKINKKELLPQPDTQEVPIKNIKQDVVSTTNTATQDLKKDIENTKASSNISQKNITMFLYKQVRLGKLEPKYIPNEYLEKVAVLLREEKKIKQSKIAKLNKDIQYAETSIHNTRKVQNEN